MKVLKVFLALSLAANVWLLYKMLDFGVTYTHAADAREVMERAAAGCLEVLRLDWVGRSEGDVLALPDRLKSQARRAGDMDLWRDGDVLAVLDLGFRVRGGKVAEVSYYGDTLLEGISKPESK